MRPFVPSLAVLLAAVGCAQAQSTQEVRFSTSSVGTLRVTTLLNNLQNPWGMTRLPGGRLLITERPGRLRIYENGVLSAPVSGVPTVWANGQGGMLDVVADPFFEQNHRIYLSYAEVGTDGKAGTAVMRAELNGNTLSNGVVILRQLPKLSTGNHFGSRLVFDGEGHLFVTLGENNSRIDAQGLDRLQGKVVRIWPDGSVPADNPFASRTDVGKYIWSYGHRNPQGAALNPWTGKLWEMEHGPMGGDEINVPEPGKNYGWPITTYGIDYNGQPIPESQGTSAPGTEQPIKVWVPSIAPSGMAFYNADRVPPWYGSVFVGALALTHLERLTVVGNTVTGEERLLGEFGYRFRDVEVMPNGSLYVLTDANPGRLLQIEPTRVWQTRQVAKPSKPAYPTAPRKLLPVAPAPATPASTTTEPARIKTPAAETRKDKIDGG
jgi:aldose sugar dehydrogenase